MNFVDSNRIHSHHWTLRDLSCLYYECNVSRFIKKKYIISFNPHCLYLPLLPLFTTRTIQPVSMKKVIHYLSCIFLNKQNQLNQNWPRSCARSFKILEHFVSFKNGLVDTFYQVIGNEPLFDFRVHCYITALQAVIKDSRSTKHFGKYHLREPERISLLKIIERLQHNSEIITQYWVICINEKKTVIKTNFLPSIRSIHQQTL